jgi:hypothetical protein
MDRNEEGGVCTQKVITVIAALFLVLTVGAVVLDSSDVDAASSSITGDTDIVKVKGTLNFDITFYETEEFSTLELDYIAVLKNSSGESLTAAVSPSSGSLSNGVPTSVTVTAPSAPGKYTLAVTFNEMLDDNPLATSEKSVTITVVEPITLKTILKNTGNVDFTDFAVYFKVDGKLIEDSKTLISAEAGKETTASYDWVTDNLSSGEHTFQLVAGEENIGDYSDVILGGEGKFYVGHSDYGLLTILVVLFLVVFIIFAIYVYRKPVKNFGKPKARR